MCIPCISSQGYHPASSPALRDKHISVIRISSVLVLQQFSKHPRLFDMQKRPFDNVPTSTFSVSTSSTTSIDESSDWTEDIKFDFQAERGPKYHMSDDLVSRQAVDVQPSPHCVVVIVQGRGEKRIEQCTRKNSQSRLMASGSFRLEDIIVVARSEFSLTKRT